MCTVLGFFLMTDADAEADCCDRIVLVGEMNGFTIGDTDLRMSESNLESSTLLLGGGESRQSSVIVR
uniref:Putative secreted protein n=1 Tax=Anopheles darlingi TaxID=43151 RepID=A0A2M4D6W4_ANODA